MTPPEMRSLDRFVTARGAALAGITSDAHRLRVMGIMASIYSIIGTTEAGIGAAFMLSSKPIVPVLLLQGGIFLLTGGLLAGVWKGLKYRMQQEPTLPVEVTPEAKALLQTLLTHLYGWPHGRMRRRRFRRLMEQGGAQLPENVHSEEMLHPETFALLESAAQEANRVYGMLEQFEGRPSSSVKQMAPAIAAAADETMAEILHIAAQMNKFPESSASVEGQVQGQIAELRALAEQMEQLCAVSETPSSTRLQTVLQSLQADVKAREELNASEPSPARSYQTAPPQEEVQTTINRSV